MKFSLVAIISVLTVAAALAAPAGTFAIGAPIERWSGADQGASGLVTGDAYFEQSTFMRLPSQTLNLQSEKLHPFPANLGFASGHIAHLYRVVSGGMEKLPGGNYLCGGGSKRATQPTYVIVTHYADKYLPGRRDITIGIYGQHVAPAGRSTDALCATVNYKAIGG